MKNISIVIAALWLCAGGCVAPAPTPAPTAPQDITYERGLWSWSIGVGVNGPDIVVPPTPPPVVPVGTVCPNCKGRGKVGDGVVMVPCPVCKGTGKVGDTNTEDSRKGGDDCIVPSGQGSGTRPRRRLFNR